MKKTAALFCLCALVLVLSLVGCGGGGGGGGGSPVAPIVEQPVIQNPVVPPVTDNTAKFTVYEPSLVFPSELYVTADGTTYVLLDNVEVWKIRPTKALICKMKPRSGAYVIPADGSATDQIPTGMQGMTADDAGNVYVACPESSTIWRITAGKIYLHGGTGVAGTTTVGQPAKSTINSPHGLLWFGGKLHVAMAGEDKVFAINGGVWEHIAGNGTYAFTGDGNAKTVGVRAEKMRNINGKLTLYESIDTQTKIRVIDGGNITTIAGLNNDGTVVKDANGIDCQKANLNGLQDMIAYDGGYLLTGPWGIVMMKTNKIYQFTSSSLADAVGLPKDTAFRSAKGMAKALDGTIMVCDYSDHGCVKGLK